MLDTPIDISAVSGLLWAVYRSESDGCVSETIWVDTGTLISSSISRDGFGVASSGLAMRRPPKALERLRSLFMTTTIQSKERSGLTRYLKETAKN